MQPMIMATGPRGPRLIRLYVEDFLRGCQRPRTGPGEAVDIHQIPYHLRNTVEHLAPPIFVGLEPGHCRPPAGLALGDTLMMLGLIRNQGRPLCLHLEPSAALRPLLESHPLVRELAAPDGQGPDLGVAALPVERCGRASTWISNTTHTLGLGVLPVDQVRANPALAHSLYYGLANQDDRPSVFVDPARPPALAGLLAGRRPTLVVYPRNPGRPASQWPAQEWWARLLGALRPDFALVAVGAPDYGGLEELLDACLPMGDPGSTLLDLAWLLGQAQGFVGCDGGLAHLAAAVNPRRVTVWDSMASYRYWAGASGHHLLFSNPYVFRYPQTVRPSLAELKATLRQVRLPDGQGGWRVEPLPEQDWERRVNELFGGPAHLARALLAQREVEEEAASLAQWSGQPQKREQVLAESLAFALRVLAGQAAQGENWVVPVFP